MNKCAKCHGEKGNRSEFLGAVPLIGPNAALEGFTSVKSLFEFVSDAMPRDAPRSLSKQDYLNVISYLLVENGIVPPEKVMTPDQIENLPLQK